MFRPREISPAIAERWAEQLPSSVEIMRIINARRELQRMVDRNSQSYETRRYRERRAAALKGRRG